MQARAAFRDTSILGPHPRCRNALLLPGNLNKSMAPHDFKGFIKDMDQDQCYIAEVLQPGPGVPGRKGENFSQKPDGRAWDKGGKAMKPEYCTHQLIYSYPCLAFNREEPEGARRWCHANFLKPEKEVGIPPRLLEHYHKDMGDYFKSPSKELFEPNKLKTRRAGRGIASKMLGKVKCVATRFVGRDDNIPVKIGGGIAWSNGDFKEYGVVDGFEMRETGLNIRFQRVYDKEWLARHHNEGAQELSTYTSSSQVLQSAEDNAFGYIEASKIEHEAHFLSSDMWSNRLEKTGRHFEVVAIADENDDEPSMICFHDIDMGTDFEQAMFTMNEGKMGFHTVDYTAHMVQLWTMACNWQQKKIKRTAMGTREPNVFAVEGIHPASFYLWIFENGLQHLLHSGKLHIAEGMHRLVITSTALSDPALVKILGQNMSEYDVGGAKDPEGEKEYEPFNAWNSWETCWFRTAVQPEDILQLEHHYGVIFDFAPPSTADEREPSQEPSQDLEPSQGPSQPESSQPGASTGSSLSLVQSSAEGGSLSTQGSSLPLGPPLESPESSLSSTDGGGFDRLRHFFSSEEYAQAIKTMEQHKVRRGKVLMNLKWSADGKTFTYSTKKGKRRTAVITPAMYIARSTIRALEAAFGLFADEDIRPGQKIAVYYGRPRHYRTGQVLRDRGEHGWCRSLGFRNIILDGRVDGEDGPFSLRFYVSSRAVAQFANTHPSFRQGANNAAYLNVYEEGGYQMYNNSPMLNIRCYLVAKTFIAKGEEIFVWYGNDLVGDIQMRM
eukprot:CAMPEP_0181317748 /NCGR_PEP_ID=MMETSP1101-20121128/16635_1 /TAXON_ID=46948 /ORGANISM="Rhodomonas abbreviata, Strain Caron Lab Isolate" /LENGTH=778 /DNA_ID=CAMNT_0023425165 /DNA_START=15 /DNA_END=2351 /DNA_ORIENTATION=+